MSELQPSQVDRLINYLARSINWTRRSFYNLGAVFAEKFGTNKRPSGQQIIITDRGIYGYDNYGNLIFYYSNDVRNVQVTSAANLLGTGLWVDLIRSVASILALSDRDGKIVMQLRPTNNGQLLITGDAGGGTTGLTFDKEELSITVDGMTMILKDSFLTLTSAGIELGDTRRIGHSGTFHRFFDDGGSSKFHGFYINGALLAQINANDMDLSGVKLKLDHAPTAIGAETVTHYMTIKDNGGNNVKVAVLT